MIAVLRDGRRVQVAEHRTTYSRTWQKEITESITTPDGEHIEGWRIRYLETPTPEGERWTPREKRS
jgi:hypothetical protein